MSIAYLCGVSIAGTCRDYIGAVLPSLRLDPTAWLKPGQAGLFSGGGR